MTQEQILNAVAQAAEREGVNAPSVAVDDDAEAFFADLEATYGRPRRVEVELPNGKVIAFEPPQSATGIARLHRESESFRTNWKLHPANVADEAKLLDSDMRYAASILSLTVVAPKLTLAHFCRMANTQGGIFLAIYGQVATAMADTHADNAQKVVAEGKAD